MRSTLRSIGYRSTARSWPRAPREPPALCGLLRRPPPTCCRPWIAAPSARWCRTYRARRRRARSSLLAAIAADGADIPARRVRGRYGGTPMWETVDASDAATTVIAMIEDPEALDEIDA